MAEAGERRVASEELEHLEEPYALAASRDGYAYRMHLRAHPVALRQILDERLERGRGPVLDLRKALDEV